jgi:hypothetical protein
MTQIDSDSICKAIVNDPNPTTHSKKLDDFKEMLEMQGLRLLLQFEQRRDEREQRREERETRYVKRSLCYSSVSLVIAVAALTVTILNSTFTRNIRIVDDVNVMSYGDVGHQASGKCSTCFIDPESDSGNTGFDMRKIHKVYTHCSDEYANPAKYDADTGDTRKNAKEE